MAGLTPKERYQAARLATNQAIADAQSTYGVDALEVRDDITALEAGTSTVVAAALFARLKVHAAGDVNVAHGNPITVTGIAVGDQIVAVLKDSTPNLTHIAITDATISAAAVTFTAADFGANDGVVIFWLDLT